MTHIFVTSDSTNYLCWYSKPVSYRTRFNETCNMACLTYDTLVTYLYIGTYGHTCYLHLYCISRNITIQTLQGNENKADADSSTPHKTTAQEHCGRTSYHESNSQ